MANYTIKGKTIYAKVENLNDEEFKLVQRYVSLGYTLEDKVLKKGISKAEMEAELNALEDKTVYNDFITAYGIKAKEVEKKLSVIKEFEKKYGINIKVKSGENEGKYVSGYHLACQIYSKWKKSQPKVTEENE